MYSDPAVKQALNVRLTKGELSLEEFGELNSVLSEADVAKFSAPDVAKALDLRLAKGELALEQYDELAEVLSNSQATPLRKRLDLRLARGEIAIPHYRDEIESQKEPAIEIGHSPGAAPVERSEDGDLTMPMQPSPVASAPPPVPAVHPGIDQPTLRVPSSQRPRGDTVPVPRQGKTAAVPAPGSRPGAKDPSTVPPPRPSSQQAAPASRPAESDDFPTSVPSRPPSRQAAHAEPFTILPQMPPSPPQPPPASGPGGRTAIQQRQPTRGGGGTPSDTIPPKRTPSRPTMRVDTRTMPPIRPGIAIAGKYLLIKRLGTGGMGEVWLARDTNGDVEVALKFLPAEVSRSDEEMRRVQENYKLVHKLRHPSIASVDALEQDDRGFVLVLEFVAGKELRAHREEVVQSQGEAAWKTEMLRLGMEMAKALDYAHARSVVHRDIKPENIMVVAGEPKVLDFGLAAEIQGSLSRVTQSHYDTAGTRPYMAPEQWKGEEQDGRTDQYALAVVIYEMLADARPFDDPNPAALRDQVLLQKPAPLPNLTPSQNAALQQALAKDRDFRFPTCVDFVKALAAEEAATKYDEEESPTLVSPPTPSVAARTPGDLGIATPAAPPRQKSQRPSPPPEPVAPVPDIIPRPAPPRQRSQRPQPPPPPPPPLPFAPEPVKPQTEYPTDKPQPPPTARRDADEPTLTVRASQKPQQPAPQPPPAPRPTPPTPPSPPQRPKGGRAFALVALLLLLTGGAGAGWYFFFGPGAKGSGTGPVAAKDKDLDGSGNTAKKTPDRDGGDTAKKTPDTTASLPPVKSEVVVRADDSLAYCLLRSKEMTDALRQQGIQWTVGSDTGDCEARLKAVQSGKVQLAAFRLDSLLTAGGRLSSLASVRIVMVVCETQGTEALLAGGGLASLQDLNDPEARVVLARNSSGEFLARVALACFDLGKAPKDWAAPVMDPADIVNKYEAGRRSEKRAYALSEPLLSEALKRKKGDVLFDSSRLTGFFVHVLVAAAGSLQNAEQADAVRAAIEAYSRANRKYGASTDGFAGLLVQDAKTCAKVDLTADDAARVAGRMRWRNATENYLQFKLRPEADGQVLAPLEQCLADVAEVLAHSGAVSADAFTGRLSDLLDDTALKRLSGAKFPDFKEEAKGYGEPRRLSDEEWGKLATVGALPGADKIEFQRGKVEIPTSGEATLKDLARQMNKLRQYYVLVQGHARAQGDPQANLETAQKRAEAAKEFLARQGISSNRVRAKAEPPGRAEYLSFVLQQPAR